MTKTGIPNSCGINQKKFNLLLKGNLASGKINQPLGWVPGLLGKSKSGGNYEI